MTNETTEAPKPVIWREILWVVLILWILLLFFKNDSQPVEHVEQQANGINISGDPVQTTCPSDKVLLQNRLGIKVVPLANYKITGKVLTLVVTGNYDSQEAPLGLSPMDVAMVWGDVGQEEYDRYISYRHRPQPGVRNFQTLWVYTKGNQPREWSMPYVLRHISNNHIIPANEVIYSVIKGLSKHEKVEMEGYLVRLTLPNGENLDSSLSRDDSGDTACEIFYVNRINTGSKVYQQ